MEQRTPTNTLRFTLVHRRTSTLTFVQTESTLFFYWSQRIEMYLFPSETEFHWIVNPVCDTRGWFQAIHSLMCLHMVLVDESVTKKKENGSHLHFSPVANGMWECVCLSVRVLGCQWYVGLCMFGSTGVVFFFCFIQIIYDHLNLILKKKPLFSVKIYLRSKWIGLVLILAKAGHPTQSQDQHYLSRSQLAQSVWPHSCSPTLRF